MSRRPFRVGRSRTGLGLFATDFIPKGTVIVEYRGRRLRNADADKLADRGAKYLYEVNNRWTIDGSNRRNLARYANHSCRPNAESDVTRQKKVIIRSIKKIQPGDEITYDYGTDYFDLIIKPLGCKCDKCLEKRRGRGKLPRKKTRAKKVQARSAKSESSRPRKTRSAGTRAESTQRKSTHRQSASARSTRAKTAGRKPSKTGLRKTATKRARAA